MRQADLGGRAGEVKLGVCVGEGMGVEGGRVGGGERDFDFIIHFDVLSTE